MNKDERQAIEDEEQAKAVVDKGGHCVIVLLALVGSLVWGVVRLWV